MPRNDKKTAKPTKSAVKHSTVAKTAAAKPARADVSKTTKSAKASTATLDAPATPAVAATAQPVAVDRQLLATLINELRSVDADRAREAAISLAGIRDVSAVEALISVLNNADSYFHSVVRSAAAASLGQQGDVRAIDALVKTVGDEMAEASAEAVRALAQLGDARAIDTLVDVLRNADGYYLPVVRLAAVHGLARFNDVRARLELVNVADDQYEDTVIRDAAIEATR